MRRLKHITLRMKKEDIMNNKKDTDEIYTIINMQKESLSIISNMCDCSGIVKL